ncbi:MAG: AraC family transcriptional regulator [Xanthobacteraceae bacterium]|nr:AraC family transcriptional regulator [Xanthobacteraceae bacterium]
MLIEDAPLVRHRLVDTRSPDEAREAIGRIFCPHFLIPRARRPDAFHARHHSAPQAGYSVNFVSYGAEVEIDPGELSGFFLLQWPLRGAASVRCGVETAEAAAGTTASLLSPTLPTRMVWRQGCEKLIVLMHREMVQKQLDALIGESAPPIEFSTGVDMTSPLGRLLEHHVETMQLSVEGDVCAPEAYQVLMRDGLTTLLLCGLRHNQSDRLAQPAGAPAPSAVGKAEDYIVAHLDSPLAVADVAAAAGANLRALQGAFRRERGMTLTQCIQTKRLERFRAELGRAGEDRSVTSIAYAVGLGHLGRAAAAYRARYGETPHQTLRRRRRS